VIDIVFSLREVEYAVGFQPAGPQLTESDEGLSLKG
jgi:hypothetical protein